MKYTAMTKKESIYYPLISVFAESLKEAERMIAIHLTGRPGRRDLYEEWVNDGKTIQ